MNNRLSRSFGNRPAAPRPDAHARQQEKARLTHPLHIAIFGPNLAAARLAEAVQQATQLLRSLGRHGHRLTFYQPDLFGRRSLWACGAEDGLRIVNYPLEGYVGLFECLEEAAAADVIIKATGAGKFDRLLEMAVLEVRKPEGIAALLDLNAHATLDRLRRDLADPLLPLIPEYDLVLTGGGMPAAGAYQALGARECLPLGSALDAATGRLLAPPDPRRPSATAREGQLLALERAFQHALALRREPVTAGSR